MTASEIAAIVYCPEAWRLEYGLRLEPGNREVLDASERHHAGKAAGERVAGGVVAVGRLLAVLAILVLPLLWGAVPIMATLWVAAGAVLALVLGLLLILGGRGLRWRLGLGEGKTVSLDRVTLTSWRYGLTGRPDRLIRAGGMVFVEEWKSAQQVRAWHRAQMGCYFLLIEEELRIRPTHGFVVCGEELRAWVLDLAGQIRGARARVGTMIPANPNPGQCRPREMRGQARISDGGQAGASEPMKHKTDFIRRSLRRRREEGSTPFNCITPDGRGVSNHGRTAL